LAACSPDRPNHRALTGISTVPPTGTAWTEELAVVQPQVVRIFWICTTRPARFLSLKTCSRLPARVLSTSPKSYSGSLQTKPDPTSERLERTTEFQVATVPARRMGIDAAQNSPSALKNHRPFAGVRLSTLYSQSARNAMATAT
jgi:hypothetical protein